MHKDNMKSCNRYPPSADSEAANFAIRFCEPMRKFYLRKATHNKIVAIKTVAGKLARACFLMLKMGEELLVERCFT